MIMIIMMVFSMAVGPHDDDDDNDGFQQAVGPHVDDDDAKLHDMNIDYI